MKEIKYYRRMDNGDMQCTICPHNCIIKMGRKGFCQAIQNIDGKLFSINYGEITAIHLDPIEKKPLYHYKPGSMVLSIGSFGCNFRCGFCQNYSISMGNEYDTIYMNPKKIIERAKDFESAIGIAYTYNEPTVFYEYMRDVAIEAGSHVAKTLWAYDKFYKKITKGKLKNVLNTIETLYDNNVHLEITHLLIEGYNDNIKEFEKMIKWISAIDKTIPLHISRYFPAYKFTAKSTNIDLIKYYSEVAKEVLDYVYIGNVANVDRNTYCPNCKHLLVRREPYFESNVISGKCEKCGVDIPIVF